MRTAPSTVTTTGEVDGHEPNVAQTEFWDEITSSWLEAERQSDLIAGPEILKGSRR